MPGCCYDNECEPSTCMRLEPGDTCGDCVHLDRCSLLFNAYPKRRQCDFFPRRFKRRAEAHLVARAISNPGGALPHHSQQVCGYCDGTGRDEEPHIGDCEECGGEPWRFWGSWYIDDKAECDECRAEDVWICGRLIESPGPVPEHYVCFPCYVKLHRDAQCCDRWRPIERLLGMVLA